MSVLFETAIVQKRNILNELRTTLKSTQELHLFSVYLSKINPYEKSTRVVRFPLSEYQKIMNFGRMNIKQIKASADSILEKKVYIPKESGGFKGINLFETFEVDKDEEGVWYIEINATNAALPFLFDFKDRYFKYELWNALRLRSANQIRMYELLKQYETIGIREIDVKELQDMLGVNYTRWDKFKHSVLDNCQQALRESTDICYTYERGKTGKGGKWVTIIFTIKKNTSYKDKLSLEKFIELQPESEYFDSDEGKSIDRSAEKEIGIEEQNYKTIIDPVNDQLSDSPEYDKLNKDIEFYNSACDDEFSENEIRSILALLNSMELPEHELGSNFAKYHYLLEQHSKFNAVAEQTKIANRYRYFYTMIENERDKQLAYT